MTCDREWCFEENRGIASSDCTGSECGGDSGEIGGGGVVGGDGVAVAISPVID